MNEKEVIEKYMAEKSELLPVTKKYDGSEYTSRWFFEN